MAIAQNSLVSSFVLARYATAARKPWLQSFLTTTTSFVTSKTDNEDDDTEEVIDNNGNNDDDISTDSYKLRQRS